MNSMVKELEAPLSSQIFTCPAQGRWSSFQLVDECGSGEPYAGLAYFITDSEGNNYVGHLDATGTGKVTEHFAGPIALSIDELYQGEKELYRDLQTRSHYPLPITELQVRAEQTRYRNHDATRTKENPAQTCADEFFQVEVRHLVKHVSHLPPQVYSHFPMGSGPAKIMGKHGKSGVALMPQRHTVLEVHPLRALRPMLSTDTEFCALNLYQLALMSTLSYCPFGQKPSEQPVRTKSVSFPIQPSVGNWFGEALAKFEELGKVDAGQTKAYYPMFEDVPYSRRLEIVPFDPDVYHVNDPVLEENQENPATIHFFDDTDKKGGTDTQAFITHHDELILISVRGTYEIIADGLRDADAFQVPFEDTDSKVHRGFYESAKKAYDFTLKYLDMFHAGQKLLICGHSLGGAVALLLSEMLRRRVGFEYNIQLYTYGAPRAADARFTNAAKPLIHHRMVAHNDPVPSVPGTWMNTRAGVFGTGAALTFVNVPVGLSVFVAGITNWTGEPYAHHGTLRHAMPVQFGQQDTSMILWEPGCDTITQHAACTVAIQQRNGLPDRPSLLTQLFNAGSHSMVGSYIPACWATLKRWQEAQQRKRSRVTADEFEWVEGALTRITLQLRQKRKDLLARPDAYVRAHEKTIEALNHEADGIQVTLGRLSTLRYQRIGERQVYGSLSAQPERWADSLARWLGHAENRVAAPLAMAPASRRSDDEVAAIYGHPVGAPHTLDIDSIV